MTGKQTTSGTKQQVANKRERGPGAAAVSAALGATEKIESIRHVADIGRSTQETHRKAIESDNSLSSKFLDLLSEQSKRAESPQERADIRREAKEAIEASRLKIDEHKNDSNAVFVNVLKYAFVAATAVGAGVIYAKLKND